MTNLANKVVVGVRILLECNGVLERVVIDLAQFELGYSLDRSLLLDILVKCHFVVVLLFVVALLWLALTVRRLGITFLSTVVTPTNFGVLRGRRGTPGISFTLGCSGSTRIPATSGGTTTSTPSISGIFGLFGGVCGALRFILVLRVATIAAPALVNLLKRVAEERDVSVSREGRRGCTYVTPVAECLSKRSPGPPRPRPRPRPRPLPRSPPRSLRSPRSSIVVEEVDQRGKRPR